MTREQITVYLASLGPLLAPILPRILEKLTERQQTELLRLRVDVARILLKKENDERAKAQVAAHMRDFEDREHHEEAFEKKARRTVASAEVVSTSLIHRTGIQERARMIRTLVLLANQLLEERREKAILKRSEQRPGYRDEHQKFRSKISDDEIKEILAEARPLSKSRLGHEGVQERAKKIRELIDLNEHLLELR